VGLGPAAIASAAGAGGTARAEPGSMASFQGQVGQWFYIDHEGWQQLQLTSVEAGPDAQELEQFSLFFRGASSVQIEEGLYSVQSEQNEIDEIFLQYVGEDEQGQVFKAPFATFQPIQSFGCGLGAELALLLPGLLWLRRRVGDAACPSDREADSGNA
jgi:hypothetical protein